VCSTNTIVSSFSGDSLLLRLLRPAEEAEEAVVLGVSPAALRETTEEEEDEDERGIQLVLSFSSSM
jgi:hypothetical protein